MRRPLLIVYLALLALSTAVRWRSGAFRDNVPDPYRSERGTGTPVVVLTDERLPAPGPRLLYDLGLQQHRATIVRGEVDPAPLFDTGPAHLIAVGDAGPEAIAIVANAPEKILSLTLIDADGIEEFDLLGDHHLNGVLRRAQIVATELAKDFIPQFGVLDVISWRSETRARRLLDVDRRRIRDQLARWNGATAIFVATKDGGIVATAREHARLLPQSSCGAWRSDSLLAFLDRVDGGQATTRVTADPARVSAATRTFDAGGLASAQGAALLVVLALLALTTLLSEDLACVTAGVLAARGSIPFLAGVIACYIGIVIGDQLLYLLGRSLGRAVVRLPPFRWWLSEESLDRAGRWLTEKGMGIVLTSRFLPGTRFPVYVSAGVLRAGFVRFALWLAIVGAVWTPLLVGASYLAARSGRGLIESLPGPTWPWALGGVLLMTAAVQVGVRAVGRRRGSAD